MHGQSVLFDFIKFAIDVIHKKKFFFATFVFISSSTSKVCGHWAIHIRSGAVWEEEHILLLALPQTHTHTWNPSLHNPNQLQLQLQQIATITTKSHNITSGIIIPGKCRKVANSSHKIDLIKWVFVLCGTVNRSVSFARIAFDFDHFIFTPILWYGGVGAHVIKCSPESVR